MGNKRRPHIKLGRNQHWNNIVNKHGYNIELISDNLTQKEALELEIKLIAFYGRKDLGLGTLVNKSNGGERNCGYICSEETRKRLVESHIGNKPSIETKNKMSKAKKGKILYNSIIILNTETGIFYSTVAEAAESIGWKRSRLQEQLKGTNKNKTKLIKV